MTAASSPRLAAVRAPRFDVRMRSGAAQLVLSEPYVGSGFRILEMTAEVELTAGVSFTGGSRHFRSAASVLRSAVVRLQPTAWLPHDCTIDRLDGEIGAAIFDKDGAVACRLLPHFEGPDLHLHVASADWVRASGESAIERINAVGRRLGLLTHDATHALIVRRPLRAILAEALLPHGWRLPDERSVGFALELGEAWTLVARGAPKDGSVHVPTLVGAALEAAALPPADTESGGFARSLESIRDGSDPPDTVVVRSLRTQSHALSPQWLRADGQLALAEMLVGHGDDVTGLVLDALAALPRDALRWSAWVAQLAERGDADALRIADMGLTGPLPRTTRAKLVASAVLGLCRSDGAWTEAIERLAERVVEAATQLHPTLPELVAADAALRHRAGDLLQAARGFERAAKLMGQHGTDTHRAGEWRRRAAELWLGLKGPAAAEPLLRQALLDMGNVPTLVADLALVLAERGERSEAEELFARLLRLPPETEGMRSALLAAVRHHVERGGADRARPFLTALGDDAVIEGLDAEEFPEDLEDDEEDERADRFDSDVASIVAQIEAPRSLVSPVSPGPQVTVVSVADDEVRALLEQASELSDARGLLEGALEQALEEADVEGVRRVIRVIERLGDFEGSDSLKDRAERLLQRLE